MDDLVLKGLKDEILGSYDVVVFGPTVGRSPTSILNLDEEVKQFFSDNFKWFMDPAYYGSGVFTHCTLVFVPTYGIIGYDGYGYPIWGFYRVPVWECQLLFNPSLFSAAALDMAVALDTVISTSSLIAGSDEATIIEAAFQSILGVVFMNGYLGSALIKDIPANIPEEIPEADLPGDMRVINIVLLYELLRLAFQSSETDDLDDYLPIHHYTTKTGRDAIASSRFIQASADGYTYLTEDVYSSGSQAMDSLSLCGDERVGFFALVSDEIGGQIGPSTVDPVQCNLPNDNSYRPGLGTEIKKFGNTRLTLRSVYVPIVPGK